MTGSTSSRVGALCAWCLFSLLALTGCSVLTIDVDVYKGPLANERDVQLHEAAVIAIGAKPLLKQFRDGLELSALGGRNTEAGRRYLELVAATNEVRLHAFSNENADRANEVMSLYSPRYNDPQIGLLLSRGLEAVERYRRGYNALRPDPLPAHRAALRHAMGGVRPLPAPGDDSSHTAEELGAAAYAELVAPRRINGRFIFYEETLWQSYEAMSARLDEYARRVNIKHANQRFETLTDADAVQADVKVYFGSIWGGRDQERESLIEITTAAARGFLEARAAIDDLLMAVLELIEVVNSPGFGAPSLAETITTELSEYAGRLVSTSAIEQALLGTPSPADQGGPERSSNERRESLRNELRDWIAPESNGSRASVPTGSELTDLLVSQVRRDPIRSVRQLRLLHNLVKHDGRDRFGIARGPLVREESLSPTEVLASFHAFASSLSGGFERGRPDKGLDDLVDDFIRASMQAHAEPARRAEVDAAAGMLLEALVQFAVKVLFVTDHAQFAGSRNETSSRRIGDQDMQNDRHLLQAIGNSILVQVNELYAQRGQDKSNSEAFARIKDAVTASEYKAEEEKIQTPQAILDRVIARLEHCLREATKQHGTESEKAGRFADALALAYEQRVRLVYIRPPSFYLKNSYPVTSLVRNQSIHRWNNMLAQHGARSTPLLGPRFANGDKPMQRSMALQDDIDRRYWQNINRVRVAGAGRTNYALVKDAVGNWSVKNYTADPEPIIKAAVAAAVVSAGGIPLAAGETGAPALLGAADPAQRYADRAKRTFAAQTRSDAGETHGFVEDLHDRINKSLADDALAAKLTGLPEIVNDEHGAHFEQALLDRLKQDRDDTDLEDAIVESLLAALRFRDAVITRMATAQVGEGVDVSVARDAARAVVDVRVTPRLQDLIQRRISSVESHRAALRALHDSASPAESTATGE